jgi:hypothetical protein
MPQKYMSAAALGAEPALHVREYQYCKPSLAPVPERAQSRMYPLGMWVAE